MRRTLVWFALLFGFWELLVGTFQLTELLAGLGAAALGVLFVELLYRLDVLRLPRGGARAIVALVWQLPVEFCVLTYTLLRGRPRGSWVTVPFAGDPSLAEIVGTATPNAIVVEVSDGEALMHSLDARLPGGRRVL